MNPQHQNPMVNMQMHEFALASTAVSIFVDTLVELTNAVFVNSINITTNIETAALSSCLIIEFFIFINCKRFSL